MSGPAVWVSTELQPPGGAGAAWGRWQNRMPNGCRWEPPGTTAEPAAAATPAACECLVVADTLAGLNWREIADVIVCSRGPGAPRGSRSEWLAEILARYPGCAVAATSIAASRCVIAAPDGAQARASVLGAAVEMGQRVMVCASVAHCWLAFGGPLAVLEGAVLRMTAGRRAVRGHLRCQGGGESWCFRVSAEGAERGLSASLRRRTSAASGAPSSL